MEKNEWVVNVEEEIKKMKREEEKMKMEEQEHWKKHSIYWVPTCVTELNKKAYSPQLVSFGPYHHGEERLSHMEEHKRRALLHFVKRSDKHVETYVAELKEIVRELMESYDWVPPKWVEDQNGFLKMMMLDGCFMLEVLRAVNESSNDYASNDPIFSHHGKLHIVPYIRRDMLMLQNQLPMLLLKTLVKIGARETMDEEHLNKFILTLCAPSEKYPKLGSCLHVLDVYRKSLLQEPPKKKSSRNTKNVEQSSTGDIIRSAMELHEAGVRFKMSKTKSLRDISFHGGVLKLPIITVDDTTESSFLNLMAFERFHVGAGNEVTSYIFFMDNIIDSAKDVSILHSSGIIQNAIGSDKAVAKLFNSLSKEVTIDPNSDLNMVHKDVKDYCNKKWNLWRANLYHTYFRSPWAILSLFAAIFLMALTIAQTVYTIYPFYQNDSSSTPPPSSMLAPSPH